MIHSGTNGRPSHASSAWSTWCSTTTGRVTTTNVNQKRRHVIWIERRSAEPNDRCSIITSDPARQVSVKASSPGISPRIAAVPMASDWITSTAISRPYGSERIARLMPTSGWPNSRPTRMSSNPAHSAEPSISRLMPR